MIIKVTADRRQKVRENFFLTALVNALKNLIPASSPDYEINILNVEYWLIELDENFRANREIGFNDNDEAILFAPSDKNLGVYTDSGIKFNPDLYDKSNPDLFDIIWKKNTC
ncbi:hypothetical protein [Hymenobacter weizhouensis]|uniref:hypothetical protein n=1 Tax=Hymenobacter sp. YIM 151500-1 TaxID=2987689 RepID=UPI002225D72E|nr:hypothetical protein [Hymenobacter sp. YIM 151500-1]UYZ62539.1 hypothetical protein OIS53_16255 [Hymenobacter sp. YIM 151500-1]